MNNKNQSRQIQFLSLDSSTIPYLFNQKELTDMQTAQYYNQKNDVMYSCDQINDEFASILQSKFYVDKTGLIKQIAKIKHKVIAIHRPKKFGKTVNARMIYHFYNCIQANQQNNMAFKFSKQNYPSLQIFHQNNFQQMYKKFPCLYFDFKNIKPNNYVQGMRLILRSLILQNQFPTMVKQHQEFIQITQNITDFLSLSSQQNEYHNKIRKVNNSLQRIAEVIQKIYGNSAYFIIDDYSQPIQHMIMNNIPHKDIQKLLQFLKILFTYFYADSPNRKLFLTGVLDILFNYQSITKFNILQQDLHQYFGFDKKEVHQLIAKYQFEQKNKQKLYQVICNWYSSYILQLKNQKQKPQKYFQTIFQPFCVQKYLKHCKKQGINNKGKLCLAKAQFKQLFNFLKLNDMFNLQQIVNLVSLIQNYKQKKQYKNFISMPFSKQSQVIQKYLENQVNENYSIYDIKLKGIVIICLISYGIISGLLNFKKTKVDYFIPNLQMLIILKYNLKKQLKNFGIERDNSHINLSNKKMVKERVQKAINSWRKIMPSQNQSSYHSMFYVIYGTSYNPTHYIFHQQLCRNGEECGYIDNAFFPITKQNSVCYIHQYKFLQHGNAKILHQTTQSALTQIYCRGYMNWGIQKNTLNSKDQQPVLIDQFVIRSIIFYTKSQASNQYVNIQIFQNRHTISEAESIIYFFNTNLIKNIIKENNNKFKFIKSQLLEKTSKDNITQLVCYIQNLDTDQINEYIQKLEAEKKRRRQQSINQLFQIFQTKNIQKLRIEQISDQILTYSQNELIQISKKENPLNKKQAKQLKQDLDKILNNKIQEKSGNPRKIKNNKRN